MPRAARIVIPNLPHHVTQRGNNQQDVFFTTDDYTCYLEYLREECQSFSVRVLGYCLMTNHVHLIAIPKTESGLAKAVGRTHWRYTQYVNRLHGRSGHLWQNRFFSCTLGEHHGWAALAYIERNPVRARIVRVPWRYRWSSAGAHVGEADRSELLDLQGWQRAWKPTTWRKEIRSPDEESYANQLRSRTRTGRPLASDRFIARIESKLGRRLRPNPLGRPKQEDRKERKKR